LKFFSWEKKKPATRRISGDIYFWGMRAAAFLAAAVAASAAVVKTPVYKKPITRKGLEAGVLKVRQVIKHPAALLRLRHMRV